ncbi:MAG: hypothetical protein J5J00_07110, partial [Deltaproteobacteria bacterium]|nr:hypothetical protein [Deltaproteobacteria bacterium]
GTIGSGTAQVDLVQDQCNADSADSATPEPFSDAIVAVHIANGSNERIIFNKIAFTVVKGGSDGGTFTTKRLAPIGGGEVAAGESKTIYGFFLKTNGTVKLASTKKGTAALSTGFKTVRAILNGKSASGKRYRLRASTTLSFSNYDRCSS